MTQIGQCAHDAVISPAAVLARKPDHQRLDFRRYPGPAGIAATAGAVELVRNQLPIPGEKGIRLGDLCDILQSFASNSLSDLGQGGSLPIRQPEPGLQAGSEDAILGHQVFVAQQQFLIDETCHK